MALVIAGDVDQNLFRWNGARPEANLFGIDEIFPDIVTRKLTTNFRSTKAIIDAQLALIRKNYKHGGGIYEDRFFKELKPREGAEEGERVTFTMASDPTSEAKLAVATILEGIARGREPGDYFVGARTRAQLGFLEGPLVRAKIPFINIAGGSFWDSRHVADIVAYAILTHDSGDRMAFKRVYNIASNDNTYSFGKNKGEYCPHRYMGPAFLSAAGGSLDGIERATYTKEGWRWKNGVEDIFNLMYSLGDELERIRMDEDKKPGDLIRFIIGNCYLKYMKAQFGLTSSDAAVNGKLEDMETVAEIADEFESVEEFLGHVGQCVRAAEDAKEKKWDEYVILSTIHRLKGLERPVVLGMGLVEGEIPKTGKPQGLLPHTFSMIPPPQFGVLPTGGMSKMEDERDAAFVLVSRGKEEVHLFGTETYRKAEMGPSRFIFEMGDCIEMG